MTYFPYLRGKQYELILIRECAALFTRADFVPIVEPVKASLRGLERSVGSMQEAGGEIIVAANPQLGDLTEDPTDITALLADTFGTYDRLRVGIILARRTTLQQVEAIIDAHSERKLAFIHAGADVGRHILEHVSQAKDATHVFFEDACSVVYRHRFQDTRRVLARDGFQRRVNREHPADEFFSDLHLTYRSQDMDGFSDFLMVGDDYTEGGGPAYAVAIHITFINRHRDEEMWIHHFKSDRQDSPTDPGGKFAEALSKLVDEVNRSDTQIRRTKAIEEFVALHNRGHFPGLGYVKKLSMQHHIETLAAFFEQTR